MFKKAFGEKKPVQVYFDNPSLTQQNFKDETDINSILSRWQKTGVVEHLNRFQGQYGDFIDYPDYQESMNEILKAQDAFSSLPSSVRKRFGNDPGAFLDFVHDPANIDEMVSMGLAKPKEPVKEPVEASRDSDGVSDASMSSDAKVDV